MRILAIGHFNQGTNGNHFYHTPYKFVNGFIRDGHCVYTMSIRDMARCESPLGLKSFGVRAVNRRAIETVENFRPDMILLMNADLLAPHTVQIMRDRPWRPRISLRGVDPLFDKKPVGNIKRYDGLLDSVFITTAGESLRALSRPGLTVCHVPNPVDSSVEHMRIDELETRPNGVFFAIRHEHMYARVEQCDRLSAALPEVKFDFRGIHGTAPVFGQAFYDAMAACRMGLSIDRGVDYLYASARMAQYMGNGLLTFVTRASKFDEIFAEDEIGFYDDEADLIRRIKVFHADDDLARHVAMRGRNKIQRVFDCRLIAKFMIERTFGLELSEDYAWPTTIY